ncbi:MAG: hypothetical protein ABIK09_01980 [Pseudomonadota bacterium]
MTPRIVPLFVLLALSLAGPASAAEMILSGKGPLANTVKKADWLPEEHGDKTYTENWMIMLRSDRGHVLYVNFLRTNIGVFQGGAGVSVSLTLPDQQAKHLAYEYKPKDFKADPETMTISIGPNALRKKGKVFFLTVKEEGFALDLELTSWTEGVKLHDGRSWWGADKKKWLQIFVHAPRASVKGTMVLGGTKVPFRGDGYLDHLRQNILGSEYASRWFVNRFFHEDWSVIFISFLTPEKHGAKTHHRFILTDREKVLVHSTSLALTPKRKIKDPKGHNYHQQYEFAYAGEGIEVTGVATGDALHDRDAMLERMSGAQAGVVKMVAGNPITYRMRGTTTATIKIDGQEPVEIEGKSWLESVVLKDE